MRKIWLFFRAGHIRNGEAILPVERSRHFFRRLRGYSLDAGLLAEIERARCGLIEFLDRESGEVARVSVSSFKAHAVRLPDYGYGLKLCCPEKFYNSETPAQGLLFGGGHAGV